ncbi:Carbon starvation induced regulator [Leclercia adecarboxylata]|uniref:Carbon starvation induced regulator n=1 Tax=Leclercia adecarboxylata TaxID=83655 RepID=A0A4U9HJK9_9ENTR|nr:Carbon starvation induced regulator [Leclercia adecarboxylata]
MRTGKVALYEDLKRHILTMELDPDELLDEAALTAQYGLSRTPVREIFQRLAGEGYLEIVEKRGVRVIPMSHSTLRNFFPGGTDDLRRHRTPCRTALQASAVKSAERDAKALSQSGANPRCRGAGAGEQTVFTRSWARWRPIPTCSRAWGVC